MMAHPFKKLTELLEGIEITDRKGAILSFQEGEERALAMLPASPRKIILIGNGGSAAIASHMQNDLCQSVGVRALVFNEAPLLTALSNDYGYEKAFERLVGLWADPGDLLIAISSSGRSESILRAVRAARAAGSSVLTLSGFDSENPLRKMGELNFYVRSKAYGEVESVHTVLSHYLTDRASRMKSGRKDSPSV